jgi:hypothetical protein
MTQKPSRSPSDVDPRRLYASPRLVVLGDLRSLTLGGSPGFGDSGVGKPRKPLIVGQAPFPSSSDPA